MDIETIYVFLWLENGDTNNLPPEFRMYVHLIGAASSPGCANFGMKQMASENETEFETDVANFVRHNFFVDDGLKFVSTISDAVTLIQKVRRCVIKVDYDYTSSYQFQRRTERHSSK